MKCTGYLGAFMTFIVGAQVITQPEAHRQSVLTCVPYFSAENLATLDVADVYGFGLLYLAS
jgi:hypothetical protein